MSKSQGRAKRAIADSDDDEHDQGEEEQQKMQQEDDDDDVLQGNSDEEKPLTEKERIDKIRATRTELRDLGQRAEGEYSTAQLSSVP